MSTNLESCTALVLNADFRPLSYFPLSLWSWQHAVKAVFMERVEILCEYDEYICSPTFRMKLPSVIALREFVPMSRRPAFTRFNVFLRDCFTCQYCGAQHHSAELTFDHVIPKSRGGNTSWHNVVTACQTCNMRKGNSMPHESKMIPLRYPKEPNSWELQENGRFFPPHHLHQSWRDFLYWDSELEQN